MSTEDFLLKNHGPLMTTKQLSDCLGRSAEGLRVSLRRECDWTRQVNAARVKFGRRVYYRTIEIAKLIDGVESTAQ